MPPLQSWRLAASALLRALGVPLFKPPSLSALRGKWRHLVRDVRDVRPGTPGTVYVGRSTCHGASAFGNVAARPAAGARGARLRAEHERCVLEFAKYLATPEKAWLRRRARLQLRGKVLLCHCAARGLPCHAEVLAAYANECGCCLDE